MTESPKFTSNYCEKVSLNLISTLFELVNGTHTFHCLPSRDSRKSGDKIPVQLCFFSVSRFSQWDLKIRRLFVPDVDCSYNSSQLNSGKVKKKNQ